MSNTAGQINLVPSTAIVGATTFYVGDFRFNAAFPKVLTMHAKFVYVADAATSCKAWIQTSLDDGATWIDVACFAFTTATANKVAQVGNFASTAVIVPTDGTLADNTVVGGILGPRLRVKVVTVGTYGVGTSLQIIGLVR